MYEDVALSHPTEAASLVKNLSLRIFRGERVSEGQGRGGNRAGRDKTKKSRVMRGKQAVSSVAGTLSDLLLSSARWGNPFHVFFCWRDAPFPEFGVPRQDHEVLVVLQRGAERVDLRIFLEGQVLGHGLWRGGERPLQRVVHGAKQRALKCARVRHTSRTGTERKAGVFFSHGRKKMKCTPALAW